MRQATQEIESDLRVIYRKNLCRLSYSGSGIIHSIIERGAVLSAQGARLIMEDYVTLCDGVPMPLLFDISHMKSADIRAFDIFLEEKATEVIKVLGMVTNSPVAKVAGSLFLGLKEVPYSAKLFMNRSEAHRWLICYLDQ